MEDSGTPDDGAVRLLNGAYLRTIDAQRPTASEEQRREASASMLEGLVWLTEMREDAANATIHALSPGAQLMVAVVAVKELRDLGWNYRFAGDPARRPWRGSDA
jgi:hypothetical protein